MLGFMETPINHFFNERIGSKTLEAFTRGPLAAHLSAYAQQLFEQGYTVSSGQSQLRMLGHFNRWLQSKGLAAEQIDSSTIERYVRCRRKSGKLQRGDAMARSSLDALLASERLSDDSTAVSALLAPRARVSRGDDHLLHSGCTRVSRGVFSDRQSRLPSTLRQCHCRLRPTPGGAHHHQTRKKRGQRLTLLLEALTPSRRDRHRLGCLRSHYCHLVTIDRAEVPSQRADPVCLGLLRSGHRDRQARLCHSASVGASRASRR